jgi:hypothetical protein
MEDLVLDDLIVFVPLSSNEYVISFLSQRERRLNGLFSVRLNILFIRS